MTELSQSTREEYTGTRNMINLALDNINKEYGVRFWKTDKNTS